MVRDLADHYTHGLTFFHEQFVPLSEGRARESLSGGAWDLNDFVGYAAGSDVDFMTHLVEAVAASERVRLFPGDWFGFRVGCTKRPTSHWDAAGRGNWPACVYRPSAMATAREGQWSAFLASGRRSAC